MRISPPASMTKNGDARRPAVAPSAGARWARATVSERNTHL